MSAESLGPLVVVCVAAISGSVALLTAARTVKSQREVAFKKEVYNETVELVSLIAGDIGFYCRGKLDAEEFRLRVTTRIPKLNRCIVMGSDNVMEALTKANHVMVDALSAAEKGEDVCRLVLPYADAVAGVYLAIRTELKLGTKEALEKWLEPMRLRVKLNLAAQNVGMTPATPPSDARG